MLSGYSLTGDVLKILTIPAHIVSSMDAPVIACRYDLPFGAKSLWRRIEN